MSPKEEIYTRHATRGGDRGKILAEIMNAEGKAEVLDDVLVLDVSSANFAGIIAASFLAEFGAEVIKIEPLAGDPARQITPFGVTVQGVGIPFMFEGRNKRYMTLDVKNNPEDRKTFAKLVRKAAVVIESFAPGEMDSWGIGYRQLSVDNPGLVYIALSAYGQYTDKAKESAKMPDTDLTSQAGSGLPAQMGGLPNEPEPLNWPLRGGMWAGWYISGLSAALGGTVALIHRQNTGQGQMVDVAGMDAYSSMVGMPATIGFTWEKARPRIGVMDFDGSLDKTGIQGEMVNLMTNDDKEKTIANIDEGIKALTKAIELRPNYFDAMEFQNLLWREKAKFEKNEKAKAELYQQADLVYQKSIALKLKAKAEEAKTAKKLKLGS